ncbi:MAG: PHD finger domain-containing protein, partial [Candidatus Thiodiazotropha endolucinida]|nr:hypothetical protein [Candidatus Thiodiazotropha taylori]MCW4343981.1 PHD finger domain-containing protein [Candidatus Thiodiazotropha endolucinida]
MFSNSKAAQSSFKEAKVSLKIITALREEEHYLKDTTTDPDSLVDIDRRQNVRRGLTNVTDHVYDFFLCLTKTCMAKLVHENLVKYGESMYNKCLDLVRSDSDLYEKFSHMVIAKLQAENVEEFHESQYSLPDYLENMVILSAQVYEIYKELVQKYFMVLFAQFRRDVKSALKVQKTMAHRKQIKVTKGTGTSTTAKQSVTQTKRKITKQKGNTRTASSKSVESPQAEPQPGPSFVVENEMNENKAADSDTDSDSGVCAKCHLGGGKDWIQCDSCNSWLHRKCAG